MIFELAWTWNEDYIPYLFSHETKTKEDFRNDVKYLMRKYGKEYIEQEFSWVGASWWIEFIAKKMPELGYTHVYPEAMSVFGAFIIENINNKDDKEFGEIIGEELLQEAIKHNNKIKKKLYYES